MEAKELRIGNLILNGAGNVSTVSSETIIDVILKHIGAEPIILTQEWLMKLGAKKEVLDAGSGIGFYDSYSIGDYELSHVFTNMWGIIGIECKPIKYVHQLQNLYFALTGLELTQAGGV
jgi:hypothetical protein